MIQIEIIDAKTWAEQFSEEAHKIAFKKIKPREWDRIDFALLMVDGEDLIGYLTLREFDHETLYIQFGGAMPKFRNTGKPTEAFKEAMNWASDVYKRVVLLAENTNAPMLTLAAKAGFLITGVRCFSGDVLVEHTLEFKNAV